MPVAVMDNKLIYYSKSDNLLFKSKKNLKNDDSLYIFLGMFFIYFFKYFWTSNPLGKYLYGIPSHIPKFILIILAIILSFYGFIKKNQYDKENIGSQVNKVNYEKFFQAFEDYTQSCIFTLFKWGFAFLIIILPTLIEEKINLLNAILCIFGIYYFINAIFDLDFFERKKIYEKLKANYKRKI